VSQRDEIRRNEDGTLTWLLVTGSAIPDEPPEEVVVAEDVSFASISESLQQVAEKLTTTRAQEQNYMRQRDRLEAVKSKILALETGD
jgi:hypothetical protein